MKRKLVSVLLVALCVAFSASYAGADALTGYYTVLSPSHPDVEKGVDWGPVTGLVNSTLGPNGLPVVSLIGATRSDGSGPITDTNSDNEILWWTPHSTLVTADTVKVGPQTDSLPINNGVLYPNGTGNDANGYQSVHWQGLFNLATDGSVTFTLGADDDAWVFIDNQLVDDNGGVKPLAYVPVTTSSLSSGDHTLDIFFADRHRSDSKLYFSADFTLNPAPPKVPEPSSLLLLGAGLFGIGIFRKKAAV